MSCLIDRLCAFKMQRERKRNELNFAVVVVGFFSNQLQYIHIKFETEVKSSDHFRFIEMYLFARVCACLLLSLCFTKHVLIVNSSLCLC